MRQARVYMHDQLAGVLSETDVGYEFLYQDEYPGEPISLTMSNAKRYTSRVMFPFFDGLIPRGGCWMWQKGTGSWTNGIGWAYYWRAAKTALAR